MRFFVLVIAIAGSLQSAPASAAGSWQEYVYPEAGFSAQFPDRPTISERAYQTSQSREGKVTERVYSFDEGGVVYSVGIADFTRVQGDADEAVEEVADSLIALGKLTFDTSIYIDGIHGREIVVLGADGTLYTNAIFFIGDALYQIKVVYPQSNTDPAGSSGIVVFQSKFQFLHPF